MKSLKSQTKVWKLSTLMVTPHMYEVVYKYNTNPASCRLINTNTIPTQLHAGLLIQIQYDTRRLHAGLLSCRVPSPRRWGKGGTIKVNRSLKVYCILSNAEITCSPDQKAVQEIVSVTDDWIKSARMSSVKIMVSSHLVESVQQARKERFMLQESMAKYESFVFPDSLECVKP